jgi:hypothetical protein
MKDELKRLEQETRKLKDMTARLINPGFSYSEQELIRRVFKSILPQLRDSTDKGTANDILEKTEWLEKIDG